MKRLTPKRVLQAGLVLVVWLAVWEVLARVIDLPFALPGVFATLSCFFGLFASGEFYLSILLSVLRILSGFLLGTLLGALLGVASAKWEWVALFFRPALSVIRSTPVASFILLLWVLIGRGGVPVAIASLMVAPILYQSVFDGYQSVDRELLEVITVFHASPRAAWKLLILPTLRKFLFPALMTAAGLAWKAGITAEIIAYTKNSIGQNIYDAKVALAGPELYAWTLAVILISLLIEFVLQTLGKRVKKHD